MPSNRELDKQVAKAVMGWRIEGSAWYAPNGCSVEIYQIPRYSFDIAAAMEVVEKMRERGYGVCMADNMGVAPWNVDIVGTVGVYEGCSDSLPEAICLAALKTQATATSAASAPTQ